MLPLLTSSRYNPPGRGSRVAETPTQRIIRCGSVRKAKTVATSASIVMSRWIVVDASIVFPGRRRFRVRAAAVAVSSDVTRVPEILSEQHRAASRAHRGVMAHEQILDAVGKHLVGAYAPDGGRHPALGVAVKAWLRAHRVKMHGDHMLRRGRQAKRSEIAAEAFERRNYVIERGRPLKSHRHGFGMACEHRCARAGSAHLDWKFGDAPLGDASKDFARLDRDALFLARNIRDDVLDDIERGQVPAGARDSLHRCDDG